MSKKALISFHFISLILFLSVAFVSNAQIKPSKFGKGLFNFVGKDSSFSVKFGMRFQNLITSTWSEEADGDFGSPQYNALIRRSRLKFDGFAYSPKFIYKFELGLTNRDQSGGSTGNYSNAPRMILDASIKYHFHKNFSLLFGQAKLPGNRERVISSGNLQFVDRSRLNSRYNIDRDFGFQLTHHWKIGKNFHLKEVASISRGEGRNITAANIGGLCYTFRVEALPFGKFQSKGDYVNSSIKRESKPKLSVGFTYDINEQAARERGQNGDYIPFEGDFNGKTLYTIFADMMFKYKGLSIMSEFADKKVEDNLPQVFENGELIGTYFTGSAFSVQAGQMFKKNNEFALRYTNVLPDKDVGSEDTRYTFGYSKFFVGHKLKIQTDVTYRVSSSDQLFYRFQVDLHF